MSPTLHEILWEDKGEVKPEDQLSSASPQAQPEEDEHVQLEEQPALTQQDHSV